MHLQMIVGEYKNEDVFSVTESGLFWKMMLHRGLAAQSMPGLETQKDRISIMYCCNAAGSDRFPLWFFGKSHRPRCLQGLSLSQMGC